LRSKVFRKDFGSLERLREALVRELF
jgi:hypothetical protein